MMQKTIRIVAVSGDPGGAEAIAPVLAAVAEKGASTHAYAYHQAVTAWTERGLAHEALSERTSEAECESILRRYDPDVLLTSTSVNGVDLERKFTAVARRLSIPSLAVVDMWTNYRKRFAD